MDKSEITKNVMKNTANMVLQDALDILDADDGRSFEEKRDAVIKRLTQKGDKELSRLLVERAIADKTGAEIKADFWQSGTVIPVDDSIFLRHVDPKDRDIFLTIQKASPLVQSMDDKAPFLDLVWREHNEDKCLMLSRWRLHWVLWNQEYRSARMGNRHRTAARVDTAWDWVCGSLRYAQ